MANIIAATLLFMAIIGIILIVIFGAKLVKMDKEKNKVTPHIDELKFDDGLSYLETQRILWNCNQTDKKLAKMRKSWRR